MAQEFAESLDLDGNLLRRLPAQFGVFKFLRNPDHAYDPPEEIPELDRELDREPEPFRERAAMIWHAKRKLRPDARKFLNARVGKADLYINSGRPSSMGWVELTRETLWNEGVLEYMSGFYFRPRGVQHVVSKGAAILDLTRRYTHVRHTDDNPLDVLGLAKILPDVEFVIVQDLTTGILFSREEEAKYHNVKRVAQLTDLLEDS